MEDDYLNEIEDIEVPDELSYQYVSQGVYDKINRKWKQLKKALSEADLSEDTVLLVDEFEELLNYFLQ